MDEITQEELNQALKFNRIAAQTLGGSLWPDLESAGRAAIVRAMQTYERDKGKFLTYCRWFIRTAQITERKNLLTAMKLPVNVFALAACVEISAIGGLAVEESEAPDYAYLYEALGKLGAQDRDILHAYYFEGANLPRLAKALNLSKEGTRQRLLRAQKQLLCILRGAQKGI